MTPTNVTISSRGFQIQTPGDLEHVASLFYKSGMFQDVTDVSKASVKIMAGMELGIPPFAAMAQIRIIKGNIAIGATLLATLLRRHGCLWPHTTPIRAPAMKPVPPRSASPQARIFTSGT
jgi:hypothetical protein